MPYGTRDVQEGCLCMHSTAASGLKKYMQDECRAAYKTWHATLVLNIRCVSSPDYGAEMHACTVVVCHVRQYSCSDGQHCLLAALLVDSNSFSVKHIFKASCDENVMLLSESRHQQCLAQSIHPCILLRESCSYLCSLKVGSSSVLVKL